MPSLVGGLSATAVLGVVGLLGGGDAVGAGRAEAEGLEAVVVLQADGVGPGGGADVEQSTDGNEAGA
eukprot:scaffold670729_cov25-Prasinocladus_malaysianus.AAC.1